MEIGGNSICFLHLNIDIQNNRIETTAYNKSTDSHVSLQVPSCQKKPSKNSIIKGAALRLHNICTTDRFK